MRYIEPSDLLNEIYDEEFSFRLANFAIKPVHVANGLARSLAGRTYDTEPLVKALRRYVRNQKLGVDEERNPNDAVLNQYGVAFEPLSGREPDLDRLTRLRSLAFDVLGADGAVFDQPDKSSFTLWPGTGSRGRGCLRPAPTSGGNEPPHHPGRPAAPPPGRPRCDGSWSRTPSRRSRWRVAR